MREFKRKGNCRVVTEEDLADVVARVDRAEANGEIKAPDMLADAPTSVIPPGKEPQAGEIVHRCIQCLHSASDTCLSERLWCVHEV